MNNISYLLTGLFLAGILGLSATPVRAYEGSIHGDVITTDVDPSDDVHKEQVAVNGRFLGWSYRTHGLAAAFGLLLRELGSVTGVMLTSVKGATRNGLPRV